MSPKTDKQYLQGTNVPVGISAICLVAAVLFLGCAIQNRQPPEYVKDIVAYKEGSDGLMVYFVLADSTGSMTTCSGTVVVVISEAQTYWSDFSSKFEESHTELFRKFLNVDYSDFRTGNVGLGAFEHEVTLCSFGRLPFSAFSQTPTENIGKIAITFTCPDGRTLSGEETFFF